MSLFRIIGGKRVYAPKPDKYKHKKPKSRNPWSPNYDDSPKEETGYFSQPQDYSQGYINPYVNTPDAPVFDTPSAQDNAANLQDFMTNNKPPHLQNRWKQQPSNFTFSQPIEKCGCEPQKEEYEFDLGPDLELPHSKVGQSQQKGNFEDFIAEKPWEKRAAEARRLGEKRLGINRNKWNDNTIYTYNLEKDDATKTLTMYANLLIFGDDATESLAEKVAKEIQTEWNAAQAVAEIIAVKGDYAFRVNDKMYPKDSKKTNLYKVVFKISHKYYNTKKKENKKELEDIAAVKTDTRNVFIFIGKKGAKNTNDRDTSATSGNSTLLIYSQINENIKTPAHEFGHNWGLYHPVSFIQTAIVGGKEKKTTISIPRVDVFVESEGETTYGMYDCQNYVDFDGEKISILMPISSLVASAYQKDVSLKVSKKPGLVLKYQVKNAKAFLDPSKRKVTRQDVVNLVAVAGLNTKGQGNLNFDYASNENTLDWSNIPHSNDE